MNQLGNKTIQNLTPPQQWCQKVMSLGIATRMLQLLHLPTLSINLRFIKNLKGISIICVAYNVSFLFCHDVIERMY